MPLIGNKKFIVVAFMLVLFGLVTLASASQVIALDKFGDPYYYLKHQLLFGILPGAVLFLVLSNTPYTIWRKLATPLFVFSLILLAAVFVPQFSFAHGGAKRWLDIGFLSFQPSEIIKLTSVIFFSALFVKTKDAHSFSHTTLPFVGHLSVIAALIALQPDIGTLSVVFVIALAVYWLAGAKIVHLGAILLVGVVALSVLVYAAPYRLARITTFLNKTTDRLGISYQVNQSLIAVGSGGMWGLGLGQSKQKYQYLPEAIGDSIFAIIAEELGFILTALFILAYLYFVLLGYTIASKSKDSFGMYIAGGIATWFCYQGLLNMSAMVGILPLTGIPLPFISYGSSSLVLGMSAIGILNNIAKYNKPT